METPIFGPQFKDGVDTRKWWRKRRWVWGLVIVTLLGASYAYDQWTTNRSVRCETVNLVGLEEEYCVPTVDDTPPAVSYDSRTRQEQSIRNLTPNRTVDSSNAFQLAAKSAYNCRAEAPADWTMSSNKESNSADLFGPGKTMYAGYGIQTINTQLAPFASAYQYPLNDPDLYSDNPENVALAYAKLIVANLGGSAKLEYDDEYNQTVGDYTLQSFFSNTHRGVVYFHAKGFPGDGVNYSYAEPMYFATFSLNAVWFL